MLFTAIKKKPKVVAVLYYCCHWAMRVRQTYAPLDEVPGLLYGGVVAGVTIQHFADDLGCFIMQLKQQIRKHLSFNGESLKG